MKARTKSILKTDRSKYIPDKGGYGQVMQKKFPSPEQLKYLRTEETVLNLSGKKPNKVYFS